MMHSGVLRTARLEVASCLPEIAPDLRKNDNAVHIALREVVAAQDIDPAMVSAADWNKTERHTYAMFGFDQMKQGFVEGDGYDAHFIDPRSRRQKILGNPFTLWGKRPASYQRNLVGMMMCRRNEVKREFTEGSDAAHRWWPYAFERHAALGRRLVQSQLNRSNISDEAINLDWALSGSSLAHFMQQHAKFIGNKRGSIDLGRRVQAAHDLVYLPLTLAGMHAINIQSPQRVPLAALNVNVLFDAQSQKYHAQRRAAEEGDNWNKVFSRGEKLDTSTLKCPARNELKTVGHAAINLGAQYDLFLY